MALQPTLAGISRPPVTIPGSATAAACAYKMTWDGERHLLAVDEDNRLIGVVHDYALFALESEFRPQAGHPEAKVLADCPWTAADIAVPAQILLAEGTSTSTALQRLASSLDDLAVTVDEQRRPASIFTEEDAVLLAIDHLGPEATTEDYAGREVICLAPHEPVLLAQLLLDTARVRHLPLVEDGRVVGVVSRRDLSRIGVARLPAGVRRRVASHRPRPPPPPPPPPPPLDSDAPVGDLIGRPPETIGRHVALRAAAQRMAALTIGCLPIVEEDSLLVGMVSRTDLVRALDRLLGEAPAAP